MQKTPETTLRFGFSLTTMRVALVLVAVALGASMAAAQYGVASRFLVPVAVLLASYTTVLQPEATRLAAISLTALGEFLSRSARLVLLLALPFVAGIWLLAMSAVVWQARAWGLWSAIVLGAVIYLALLWLLQRRLVIAV